MEQIEKIRQEVLNWMKETNDSQFSKGERFGYNRILGLLTLLDLDEPKDDIEKAAYEYSFESRPSVYGQVDVIDAFKAGAEWMSKQMNNDNKPGAALHPRSLEHRLLGQRMGGK